MVGAELPDERLQDHDEFVKLEERTAEVAERVRGLLPEADELLGTFSGIDREGY